MGCSNCNSILTEENENKGKKIELNPKSKNKIEQKFKKEFILSDNKMKFISMALTKNNYYRKKHKVDELKLDKDLSKRAFILAYQKLEEGNFSNNYQKNEKNEDLGLINLESNEKLEAEELIKKWYSDLIEYNPKEPNEYQCLDSTQIIWKNSKKFGIGYYKKTLTEPKKKIKKEKEKENKEKNIYCYVALYYPAGNQPDQFKENIINAEENISQLKNKENINKDEEIKIKNDEKINNLKEEEKNASESDNNIEVQEYDVDSQDGGQKDKNNNTINVYKRGDKQNTEVFEN